MKLNETHFKKIEKCPWCGCESKSELYINTYDAKVVRCKECRMVYSTKILNDLGLKVYWNDYESQIHNSSLDLSEKRRKMYQIESDFIKQFLGSTGKAVLDVGCADGSFLDFFSQYNQCEGVELGKEAYDIASKKYKVYLGDFADLNIEKSYDLIIFRGTIQYFLEPKKYFIKAMELLNKDGILFITSSPNSESICFELFGKNFTLPAGVTDYWVFSESLISNFIKDLGGELVCSHHFYLEGPYANPEQDIITVAKALEYKAKGKIVDFKGPPFFDNMLTLVYRKRV